MGDNFGIGPPERLISMPFRPIDHPLLPRKIYLKAPYPLALVRVDTKEAIIRTIPMSIREVGRVWRRLCLALIYGREEEVLERSFVVGLRLGPFRPFGRGRRQVPGWIRELIFERDGRRCRQCGTRQNLQIDHVYPFSRGGTHDPSNLQVLCMACNYAKAARVPWNT